MPYPTLKTAALVLTLGAGGALLGGALARQDAPAPPPALLEIDDEALGKQLLARLSEFARADGAVESADLEAAAMEPKVAKLKGLARPAGAPLAPEEVYRRALSGVVVFGSVVPTEKNPADYETGRLGTAFAITPDVFATCAHVFDDIEAGEVFGVLGADGKAFALTELVAIDRAADVAAFRAAGAKVAAPLPLAASPPPVGAWVGVLSHPGDRYFSFTQGAVSRHLKQDSADFPGTVEHWTAITADYASGSSGGPVLDRFGQVVGVAALTEAIEAPDDAAPAVEAVRRRRKRKAAEGSPLQMVVKLTAPASAVHRLVGAGE